MDLMDRFEQATSGGPAHRPLEDRLVAGRRAQARRRITRTVSAVAATTAVVGVAWALQPGADPSSGDGIVASDASATPDPVVNSDLSDGVVPPPPTVLFGYDLNTARLEIAPGVTVVRQVDDPVPNDAVTSAAAVVTYEGERKWVMAAVVRGQSGWASDLVATSGRSFEQWVRELTVLNTRGMFSNGPYEPGWVTLDAAGMLTANDGVTIVEQSSPARIDQAPANAPSAAGTIEVDGARLCVVARKLPGEDADITYLAETEHRGCGDAVPGIDYPGAPDAS
ncbi:hypothetical protein [uncultured Nocardioides sp.]|nr:hypothetical protein [uncultured Nocardioides sp.]